MGGGAPTSIPNKRGQTPLTIQPLLFAAPLLTCSQVSEYEKCISEYVRALTLTLALALTLTLALSVTLVLAPSPYPLAPSP